MINILFFEFYETRSVAASCFEKVVSKSVHCSVNINSGGQEISAWTGRSIGVCDLAVDNCGNRHFLKLTTSFSLQVQTATLEKLENMLRRSPEEVAAAETCLVPCFGIRYPTLGEIAADYMRFCIGVPNAALGTADKLQCVQFCLLVVIFLLQEEHICEHPPPRLLRLAKRGSSLTPDALWHELSELAKHYPRIQENIVPSGVFLDTPMITVPLRLV